MEMRLEIKYRTTTKSPTETEHAPAVFDWLPTKLKLNLQANYLLSCIILLLEHNLSELFIS